MIIIHRDEVFIWHIAFDSKEFPPYCFTVLFILTLLLQLFAARADLRGIASSGPGTSAASSFVQFLPCAPESEFLVPPASSNPSAQFCQQWNPDFSSNGHLCCSKSQAVRRGRKRRPGKCSSHRAARYCQEVTPEQVAYLNAAGQLKGEEILSLLTREMGRRGDQAYCSVNNGFLVRGRPIISNSQNRVLIRSPERCLNYGTDAMAAMVEWLGREVSKVFSSEVFSRVRLVLGDVSGPKGGCLIGRSGRRGHASHTNGQDADVGFLDVKRGKASSIQFVRDFDSNNNWWLLKKILKNPYACIKVIFLDRRHIRALSKYAQKDEDWEIYRRFIRHMPGHKNHFHVRIGNGPGSPGCFPGAKPELELEEDFDSIDDPDDSEILDQLKASQSRSIQE